MNFFKNFFDDERQIIGLCGFGSMKPRYVQNLNEQSREKVNEPASEQEFFFNPFQKERMLALRYETNFAKNMMLL